jgi:hypothetical protein
MGRAGALLGRMWTLALPFETWHAIIDTLRERTIPYMLEHADILEQRVDQVSADRDLVRLSLGDELYLRSVYWAGWSLGMRLPVRRG